VLEGEEGSRRRGTDRTDSDLNETRKLGIAFRRTCDTGPAQIDCQSNHNSHESRAQRTEAAVSVVRILGCQVNVTGCGSRRTQNADQKDT
jgi:hypothetical protein